MRSSFMIVGLMACTLCGLSQTTFESQVVYTREEGLSNNTVTSIVKDSRGFLWLGTSEGLNRFDGRHFVAYYSEPGDFATLSGNNIFDIIQYQPGMLLIATNNGISVFNTFINRFENDRIQEPALKKGSGIYIRSLFNDTQGHVYINYAGKIDVFDKELHFLYCLTDTKWGCSIRGIDITYENWIQDKWGRIWIPSDNLGICILDEKAKQVYSFLNNPKNYSFLRQAPVRSFFYDEPKQQLFVSFWGEGLTKYDLVSGRKIMQDFNTAAFGEAKTINAITKINNRLICCGTFCIYNVDPETLNYSKSFQNINDPAISFTDCYSVLNDTENLWVGMESRGLFQIAIQAATVEQVVLPYSIRDYTSGCTGIQQLSKDFLYFAYGEDGLIELNQQTFSSIRYPVPQAGNTLPYISKIFRYDDRRLLVGTLTGLYFFDTKTKEYSRTNIFPASTDRLRITAMTMDQEGNCWIASNVPNTLGYYERKSNRFTLYPNYVVDGLQVFNPDVLINRMNKDQDGSIWMSSSKLKGGISRWEPATGQWTKFGEGENAARVILGRELSAFYIKDSVIWTGNSYGMGLIRYDYNKDSVQLIGRKDGLPSENILAITSDQEKNLFISTQSGISYYNINSGKVRTLNIDDSQIDWGFAYAQFFDSLNSRLVYALNDRIIIANKKLWEKPVDDSVPTFIDEIKVNNEPAFFQAPPLKLNHDQRNISIQFTAINYSHHSDFLYAFKMLGVDKIWTMSQKASMANYSNLGPGNYTFLVKARGNSGNWGPVNDRFRFIILPAIWQTIWFWMAMVLLASLIIFVIVRRRIQYIRKSSDLKQKLAQKLAETEMMALRSQMNPHFIFNCLNAIDSLMQTNQSERATMYLAQFAKLIRSVLENSKSNEIPFHKDFETLQLYLQLEQFRAGNKFFYELKADQELINGSYKIPPLIIQPFIENAILHGLMNKESDNRHLFIEAKIKESFICYTIIDNGVGRKMARKIKERNRPERQSYGISITAERLQLHNQQKNEKDIVITDLEENGIETGTRIDVMINIDH